MDDPFEAFTIQDRLFLHCIHLEFCVELLRRRAK